MMMMPEIAFVTEISGVCNWCVTFATVKLPINNDSTK